MRVLTAGQGSLRSRSLRLTHAENDMARELKTHRVNLKLTDSDYSRMRTLMDAYGYRSVSIFWRDLLNGRRLTSRRRVDRLTERSFFEAMNRMTAQVAAVGRNYNQVVSRIEALSAMRRPDGSPVIGEAALSRSIDMLQRNTVMLRDEVAVCIEMVDRYTREMEGTGVPDAKQ